MAQADELILTNVRCFQGEQRGRLRPITLLVGENSTGKSTFLGCFGVVHQMLSPFRGAFGVSPDFNQEPFSMGSFRDIVRTRRGPSGRINEFKLGVNIRGSRRAQVPYELVVTFVEQGSQPVQSSYRYHFGSDQFLELRQDGPERTILSIPNKEVEIDVPLQHFDFDLDLLLEDRGFAKHFPNVQPIVDYLQKVLGGSARSRRSSRSSRWSFRYPLVSELIPVAPLRAKPKRTYDPVREIATPEGEHIPMLTMRLDHLEKSHWQSLHDDLVDFGNESGLFSDIKVRRHGKQISDPFQLQVKVQSSSHANIMESAMVSARVCQYW